MEMNAHLSESDLVELLLQPASATPSHAQHCEKCRLAIQDMQRGVSRLAGSARTEVDRPEEFWLRQRAAIRSRLHVVQPVKPRLPQLAWVTATVVLGIASLMLTKTPQPLPAAQLDGDSDHQLLVEVEEVLQIGGPPSLEPAAFLAGEISENFQPVSTDPAHKEKHQ
ncbi:MAG: hypothetical protein LAO03_17570 [Acidobacteriia bacterium]|nr:hypothetical protein [Terriglobia bacterium]